MNNTEVEGHLGSVHSTWTPQSSVPAKWGKLGPQHRPLGPIPGPGHNLFPSLLTLSFIPHLQRLHMLYMDTEAQLSPVPQIQPPPLCHLPVLGI